MKTLVDQHQWTVDEKAGAAAVKEIIPWSHFHCYLLTQSKVRKVTGVLSRVIAVIVMRDNKGRVLSAFCYTHRGETVIQRRWRQRRQERVWPPRDGRAQLWTLLSNWPSFKRWHNYRAVRRGNGWREEEGEWKRRRTWFLWSLKL